MKWHKTFFLNDRLQLILAGMVLFGFFAKGAAPLKYFSLYILIFLFLIRCAVEPGVMIKRYKNIFAFGKIFVYG